MRHFSVFFIFIGLVGFAYGQAPTAKDLYLKGLSQLQQKQLEEAKQSFQQSLEQQPESVPSLYNLGLVHWKLKNRGTAMGLWRRALTHSPRSKKIRESLNFSTAQLEHSLPTPKPGSFESLSRSFLKFHSLNQFFAANFIFLFCFSLLLLRYMGRKKLAFEHNSPLPKLPYYIPAFAILCLAGVLLLSAKLYDQTQTRGTITKNSTKVYSGPTSESSEIFEVLEGYEVLVRRQSIKWAQVEVPGGLIGWINKDSLILTRGEKK